MSTRLFRHTGQLDRRCLAKLVGAGLLLLAATSGLSVVAGEETAYTVGAGDEIDVRVGGESELSGRFRVSDEGLIVYPLLGALDVQGQTLVEIAKLIRQKLDRDYLVDPQVAVYVSSFGSKRVQVLGDVGRPGKVVLREDRSLLTVLVEAGVDLAQANTTLIVTRGSAKGSETGEAPLVTSLDQIQSPWQEQKEILLRDGDQIFVDVAEDRNRVQVSGRVENPGSVPLKNGMTLMEAIGQAGGLSEFGSLKGVRVIRESTSGTDVMTLDLSAVLEGDKSQDVVLQNGDIIVVPRRWF